MVISRVSITPEQVKTYERALEKTRERAEQDAQADSQSSESNKTR
jgi:hypothetical protein